MDYSHSSLTNLEQYLKHTNLQKQGFGFFVLLSIQIWASQVFSNLFPTFTKRNLLMAPQFFIIFPKQMSAAPQTAAWHCELRH